MKKKYVIVGGVAGGAGTAARLRRLDEQADIVMFERGEYISYANCGLPYYAGNVITERSRLFIMTPERFRQSLDIDARVRTEVLSIDRKEKTVHVRNLADDTEYDERYDTLVLSPGANPIRPRIPGIDNPAILSLRSVSDIDAIKDRLDKPAVRRAVVVGGGFIGLEMAENMKERGMDVSVVEAQPQVMGIIDYDLAAEVQQHMRSKGVHLYVKDGVQEFEPHGETVTVCLASGRKIDTDIVILSIGVRPDTKLAKDAGLELTPTGAIIVDEYFATNDPSIRAVGDAIAFKSPLSGAVVTVPLAGPANKQARLCAENIVKGSVRAYEGTIGTSVAKVFDMTVASTGLTGKQLESAKLPYREAVTHASNHAGYYPGSTQLTLKLLYDPETGKVWGAQAVGYDGVDKRIDVVSAFIGKGGTVKDLGAFEQAYAPPFSSAKDPVNMVGFIGENVMEGLTDTITVPQAMSMKEAGAFMLDVRSPEEFELGHIEGAVNIPHTELRGRLAQVPKDRTVVINCAIGLRGYLAERVLRQNGWTDVHNLTGGYKSWEAVQNEQYLLEHPEALRVVSREGSTEHLHEDGSFRSSREAKSFSVDACGLQCPGPIIRLKKEMDALEPGDRLTMTASDPGFATDVRSWCDLTGNTLVSLATNNGVIEAVIGKGDPIVCPAPAPGSREQSPVCDPDNGATLIVFSNDLDRALAAFVLANGAAATGKHVTMFFTFWGLSVVRKAHAPKVRKDFMGRMFSGMLPKGMDDLSLSSMNMAGIGAKMMKGRMRKKNVDQLRQMFDSAKAAGVKMIACQMSMDIMGITKDELLDGIEVGGVATYMGEASYSKVNLFV